MNSNGNIRKYRVLSVDNQPLFSEGLRTRIERESNLEWVGSTSTCENVVAEAHRTNAEIAIIEIGANGGDCFEAIRDVTSVCPQTRVMVLTSQVRDRAIDEALGAGALAYFSKEDEPDAVIEGINAILRGERILGPSVQGRCIEHAATGANGSNGNGSGNGNGTALAPRSEGHANGHAGGVAKYNLLTPREREVLRMIGQGMSRRAIAEAMHRSPKTVDCHRAAVMEKLGINDRVELARYAIREGIAEA